MYTSYIQDLQQLHTQHSIAMSVTPQSILTQMPINTNTAMPCLFIGMCLKVSLIKLEISQLLCFAFIHISE